MKKTLFALSILAASLLGVTGCHSSNKNLARVTYGTLVAEKAMELNYGDLAQRIARKENMLLSVYDDSGTPCGCWTTFHAVIDSYVKEYDTMVYYIGRSQFSDDAEKYGLTILTVGTDPTFAFIKDGKKTNEYIYGKDTKPMFSSLSDLRTAVSKIARDPQYFFVDEEYLDNALFTEKKDKVIVQYIWNFCPDCLYCFPNVMFPYSEKNEFKTKIWLIDLGVKGYLLDDDGKWLGTSNPPYVEFMKEHHLSQAGDEVFGYDRGFVPSIQVWEKGVLKDMNVYFNDEVTLQDNKYIITRS